MSVLVEIFRIPEPVERNVPFIGLYDPLDIPFLDDEFLKDSLDLNFLVSGNREATFFARVKGDCQGSKYREGDVLVVDRSLPLRINQPVVCCIGNEFEVKFLKRRDDGLWLEALSGVERPLLLTEKNQLMVWGRVTFEVRKVW